MKIETKLLIALVVAGLCLGGAALAEESKTSDAHKTEAKSTGASSLSASDKDFMMTAAKDGMREVHMGQMGQKQGKSAEVKRLANVIVTDHTKANNQLMDLAKKKGVTLDTKHDMDKIDDDDFDKEWLAMMVKDHKKDISAFEKASKNASDPDLKSWAGKTLPTLQKHLREVEAAQKKMESGGASDQGAKTEKKS